MPEILLLGPDRERAAGLRTLLRQDGHSVHWARSIEGWRETESLLRPDLVVAAVPVVDPVLSERGRRRRGFPAPLLLVQTEADPFRDVQLDERLVDRIESPFMAEDLLGRVDALVRVRRVVRRERVRERRARRDPESFRDAGVRDRFRSALQRWAAVLGTRVPRYAKTPGAYLEVAARTAEWADGRDAFEPGHAERVTTFTAMIADALGLPDNEAAGLLRAAMLHDIGKVALPVEVLRHEGPLDESQRRVIRTHPERGAAILRALDPEDVVAEAVLNHHERPDGTGYYGRSGQAIPRSARILAVAETFDAMTSCRYRAPLSRERALEVLRDGRGTQFDGEYVDALDEAIRPRPRSIPLSTLPT